MPSILPRGRAFTRAAIVKALGQHGEYASSRWGQFAAAEIVKTLITPVDLGDFAAATDTNAREFFVGVQEASVIGRLQGLRVLPWDTPFIGVAGSGASWVGEGQPAPLSRPTMTRQSLAPKKIVAHTVITREALENQSPEAEAAIQADLERVAVLALDQALLDPTGAGTASTPASIVHGNGIVAGPDLGDDLALMLDAFQGDLSAAYWVGSPRTAVKIAAALDIEDLGMRGGSLMGAPFLTTRGQLGDSGGSYLTLVDPSGIAARVEGVEVDRSRHATVQMESAPDSPVGAGTVMVSLWQQNLVALRVTIYANWATAREGSVVVLELND
jgi:hypothetical protein